MDKRFDTKAAQPLVDLFQQLVLENAPADDIRNIRLKLCEYAISEAQSEILNACYDIMMERQPAKPACTKNSAPARQPIPMTAINGKRNTTPDNERQKNKRAKARMTEGETAHEAMQFMRRFRQRLRNEKIPFSQRDVEAFETGALLAITLEQQPDEVTNALRNLIGSAREKIIDAEVTRAFIVFLMDESIVSKTQVAKAYSDTVTHLTSVRKRILSEKPKDTVFD
jgi:hypothetical protein